MDSTSHRSFNAADRSYFSILKKDIHQMAALAGFSSAKIGELDIVVAEMASNLIKHAGGGEILARVFTEYEQTAIELISLDSGPGMADPGKMIEDGMSTTNTLGHGLGAIKRLSDTFQLYSVKDWGTIALSRIYLNEQPIFAKKQVAEVRPVVVAKPGESYCGDGASFSVHADCLKILLGDGLGHGEEAYKAVQLALDTFNKSSEVMPADILRSMHVAVKKTRGLVGTVAVYNFKEKKWRISGVGNIATRLQHSLSVKNCMSYNGIIGMNIPNTLKEQEIGHERGQILIMCSDGIKTRWDMQKHSSIFKYDLSIAATAIYKDFSRKTDDMSVVVARIN